MKVYFKKCDDRIWIISGVSKGTRWAPGDKMISLTETRIAIKKIIEKFPSAHHSISSSNNTADLEFCFDEIEDEAFFMLWSSNGIAI
jgi:hypothetical protein